MRKSLDDDDDACMMLLLLLLNIFFVRSSSSRFCLVVVSVVVVVVVLLVQSLAFLSLLFLADWLAGWRYGIGRGPRSHLFQLAAHITHENRVFFSGPRRVTLVNQFPFSFRFVNFFYSMARVVMILGGNAPTPPRLCRRNADPPHDDIKDLNEKRERHSPCFLLSCISKHLRSHFHFRVDDPEGSTSRR